MYNQHPSQELEDFTVQAKFGECKLNNISQNTITGLQSLHIQCMLMLPQNFVEFFLSRGGG